MPNDKFNRYKRDDSERWAIFEYANQHGNRAASEKFGLSIVAVKEIRRRIRIRSLRDRERKGITAERFRVQCLKKASFKGNTAEDQQEFASWAVLRFLESDLYIPERVDWEYSKWVQTRLGGRVREGKLTQETADIKKNLYSPERIDHILNEVDSESDELNESQRSVDYDAVKVEHQEASLIEFPKTVDGMITKLTLVYGFKQQEIADMLGVSASHVYNRIEDVKKEMREKYGS